MGTDALTERRIVSDNEQTDLNQLGQRVSALDGMFREFLQRDERYKEELARTIRAVDDKASTAGKTDMGTLALWAGIIISIIVAIGGMDGYYRGREMDRLDSALLGLDAKLQREMNLINTNTDTKIEQNQSTIFHRHDDLEKRVQRLETWQDGQRETHTARRLTAKEFLDGKSDRRSERIHVFLLSLTN